MFQLVLIQILVCIVQFYIATSEKIKNIFIVTLVFNILNLMCYILNGDKTTSIAYIIICIRSFIYIYRDVIKKYKFHYFVPIIFIIAQIVIGLSTIDSILQLIPILIPCYVNYYLWFYDTTQKLRIGNFIGNFMWFIYNFFTGLWIISISRLIVSIMNVVSYLKFNKAQGGIK